MTTTGTYAFNPTLAQLVTIAFGRCGIRKTQILQTHLYDAQILSNLILQEWANEQPRLWNMSLLTASLSAGTTSVTCSTQVSIVLDCWVTTGGQDVVLAPMTRSFYSSLPAKTTQGTPGRYWFERLNPPTITIYPTPNASMTLNYYAFTQDQDAQIAGMYSLDIPNRFLMAFTDALALELALIYAPDKAEALAIKSETSRARANAEDVDIGPLSRLAPSGNARKDMK